MLAGQRLELADEYCYLGLEFGGRCHRISRWRTAVGRLLLEAEWRARELLYRCGYGAGLQPSAVLALWKVYVQPKLDYGACIWSVRCSAAGKIESMFSQFARQLLRLGPATPKAFLRGELGAQSQRARRDYLTLSYWQHLVSADPRRLLSRVFRARLATAQQRQRELDQLAAAQPAPDVAQQRRRARVAAGKGSLSWCADVRRRVRASRPRRGVG